MPLTAAPPPPPPPQLLPDHVGGLPNRCHPTEPKLLPTINSPPNLNARAPKQASPPCLPTTCTTLHLKLWGRALHTSTDLLRRSLPHFNAMHSFTPGSPARISRKIHLPKILQVHSFSDMLYLMPRSCCSAELAVYTTHSTLPNNFRSYIHYHAIPTTPHVIPSPPSASCHPVHRSRDPPTQLPVAPTCRVVI